GRPPRVHAAAGDPFNPADATVFVAQNVPTQLFKAIPDANGNVVFQSEGGAQSFNYNAIAYNTNHNYIHAIKTSGPTAQNGWPQGSVIRIGESGHATRVGTGTIGSGSVVGAFGDDGFYYVLTGGTTFRRINPNNGAITASYTVPTAPAIADMT